MNREEKTKANKLDLYALLMPGRRPGHAMEFKRAAERAESWSWREYGNLQIKPCIKNKNLTDSSTESKAFATDYTDKRESLKACGPSAKNFPNLMK